mmetsp:Transcript_81863/g.136847  ORF Transcript_81863/g.136847 Transcript_81863/m.136847 type:complete len:94 (+) Transcript_81863:175-456(+)
MKHHLAICGARDANHRQQTGLQHQRKQNKKVYTFRAKDTSETFTKANKYSVQTLFFVHLPTQQGSAMPVVQQGQRGGFPVLLGGFHAPDGGIR